MKPPCQHLKSVFLDGCNSAAGDWPQAFGIQKAATDYSKLGRKNRAFMGWQH
ncbi:MAG: hypothetical protein ABSA97_14085 [Verrucomicrobiia bacterium]